MEKKDKEGFKLLIKAISLLIWTVLWQWQGKTKSEKEPKSFCVFQDKVIFTSWKICEFVLGLESSWDVLIISFQAN